MWSCRVYRDGILLPGAKHHNKAFVGSVKYEGIPFQVIVNIAKVILKVVGAIALAMFVLGGLLWLTSAGKQQQVAKGKKIFSVNTTDEMLDILDENLSKKTVVSIKGVGRVAAHRVLKFLNEKKGIL